LEAENMHRPRLPLDEPPERAADESEADHVHRTTLWALAHPDAGVYRLDSAILERIMQHTIGMVQGKEPGAVAVRVAELRRAVYLTLRLRAAEEKTAEARQAATRRQHERIEGGSLVPRGDVPPPKAPPARLPEPEGAL